MIKSDLHLEAFEAGLKIRCMPTNVTQSAGKLYVCRNLRNVENISNVVKRFLGLDNKPTWLGLEKSSRIV